MFEFIFGYKKSFLKINKFSFGMACFYLLAELIAVWLGICIYALHNYYSLPIRWTRLWIVLILLGFIGVALFSFFNKLVLQIVWGKGTFTDSFKIFVISIYPVAIACVLCAIFTWITLIWLSKILITLILAFGALYSIALFYKSTMSYFKLDLIQTIWLNAVLFFVFSVMVWYLRYRAQWLVF